IRMPEMRRLGINGFRRRGLALAGRLLAAAMIIQPISRHTLDVALSARFKSHRAIPMNAALTTRIRRVVFDLRSAQRLEMSQKKNRVLSIQSAPRLFLPPVTP